MRIVNNGPDAKNPDYDVRLVSSTEVVCVRRAFEEYTKHLEDVGNEESVSEFDRWVLRWSVSAVRKACTGESLVPLIDALTFFRDNTEERASEIYEGYMASSNKYRPETAESAADYREQQGITAGYLLATIEEHHMDSDGGILVTA